MKNLIDFNLTSEEQTKVENAFGTLRQILVPKLVNLSPEDIRNMVNMGNKNMSFASKAAEIADKNPHLVPDVFDLDAFRTDLDSTFILRDLKRTADTLANLISDSLALAGSEALQAAFAFYAYLKVAVKMNVPGAETAYNELSEYFPGRDQKRTDEETTEEAT